jgi:hypothetical protein
MHDTVLTFADADHAQDGSAFHFLSRLCKAELRLIAAKVCLSGLSWLCAIVWIDLERSARLDVTTSFALGFLVLLLTLFLTAASAVLGVSDARAQESSSLT